MQFTVFAGFTEYGMKQVPDGHPAWENLIAENGLRHILEDGCTTLAWILHVECYWNIYSLLCNGL